MQSTGKVPRAAKWPRQIGISGASLVLAYRLVHDMELFPPKHSRLHQVRNTSTMATAPNGARWPRIAYHHCCPGSRQVPAPIDPEVILKFQERLANC